MTATVLRNGEKATWDEQVDTPAPTGPEPTLHAHTGAPSGTLRDTLNDGRVYRLRVTR